MYQNKVKSVSHLRTLFKIALGAEDGRDDVGRILHRHDPQQRFEM